MQCKVIGKSFMSFTAKSTGELIERGTVHVIWEADPQDDEFEGNRVEIVTGLSPAVYKLLELGKEYEPRIKTKAVKDSYGNQIPKAIIYGFDPVSASTK